MSTAIAYYNENDPKAAAWLRELIKEGHIMRGIVDDRSILDVKPADLAFFTQCHFFAGIGGWSYALRLARWPDDRPVWTGSCPCQPFSAAGKRGGTDDARHLWPEFYRLISFGRPATVFGEQVASKDGLAWLDIVSADLERADYAVGAADMCAAGVGAPHIRQRLYFVGHANGEQQQGRFAQSESQPIELQSSRSSHDAYGLADGNRQGLEISGPHEQRTDGEPAAVTCSDVNKLAYAYGGNASPQREQRSGQYGLVTQDSCSRPVEHSTGEQVGISRRARVTRSPSESAAQTSVWSTYDLIPCTDGKARPVESGTFPLAHGIPHRVGLLRGYGNAIVPQVAAAFIQAYLEYAS